jgi:hypothetical protein
VGEGARRDTRRRLSVSEAAGALGITVDAVRSRVKRGTIAHERVGGRVYVLLDTDQSRPGHDQGSNRPTDQAHPDALIEALDEMREQVRYLREQVQAEREAHAEARRLLLLALERIPPALEPSQEEPQESPESPGPTPTPTEERGGQQEDTERPWWRRMFGG